ncbi:MAG: hypothetical protein JJT94_13245 [Bernardetiaceae bacterium]|nr:hypothetical protein [Bernardetiaceae bacterium]
MNFLHFKAYRIGFFICLIFLSFFASGAQNQPHIDFGKKQITQKEQRKFQRQWRRYQRMQRIQKKRTLGGIILKFAVGGLLFLTGLFFGVGLWGLLFFGGGGAGTLFLVSTIEVYLALMVSGLIVMGIGLFMLTRTVQHLRTWRKMQRLKEEFEDFEAPKEVEE